MSRMLALFLSVAAASFTPGCYFFEKSPADRAAEVERLQCESNPGADTQLLQSVRVLYVQPEYSYHLASGIAKVVGTRIGLRPPEGVSPDRMSRILQCHGARGLLGHLDRSRFPHDPYFLPDAWVSIDVKAEQGNFVAILSTDTVTNNLRVLHAANDLAASQQPGAATLGLQ